MLGEQFLDPIDAERADELALEVGVAREEAERLEFGVGATEPGRLDSAPHIRDLPDVEETHHAAAHRLACECREMVMQVRHPAHRHDGRARRYEVEVEPIGEGFDREPVALTFDEHDRAGCPVSLASPHEPTLPVPGQCAYVGAMRLLAGSRRTLISPALPSNMLRR